MSDQKDDYETMLPDSEYDRHFFQVPWYLSGVGAGLFTAGAFGVFGHPTMMTDFGLTLIGATLIVSVMVFMVTTDA